MLLISSLNYPGGEALTYLRDLVQADSEASAIVPVHADVLACMTGVTLFGTAMSSIIPSPRGGIGAGLVGQERGAGAGQISLLLDKTENPAALAKDTFWRQFDYILMEDPKKAGAEDWETVGVVLGYRGIEVIRGPDGGEKTGREDVSVVGRGAVVETLKQKIRALTGGLWVGPRMRPAIYILKRVKGAMGTRESAGA